MCNPGDKPSNQQMDTGENNLLGGGNYKVIDCFYSSDEKLLELQDV